ncbi:MAG: hypothetical protein EH225_02820, partial [Calditrichaeota bacterium]
MKNSFSIFIFTFLIFSLLSSGFSLEKDFQKGKMAFKKPSVADAYPDVNITWIGIGELTRFAITNTGQQGYWTRPTDWTGYDGTFPDGTFQDGDNAEWPAGTNQSYCFSSSLWIGGEIPIIAGGDTLYWERRVDTGAYTDEWGTVTALTT